MRSTFPAAVLSAMLLFSGPTFAEVPLPYDIKVIAPAAGLPPQLAAFSGKWNGTWSGTLEAVLIVEEIDAQRAKVIYAWGDAPTWQIVKGFRRYQATVGQNDEIQFKDDTLTFTIQMNANFSEVRVTRTAPPVRVDIESFRKAKP